MVRDWKTGRTRRPLAFDRGANTWAVRMNVKREELREEAFG